MLDAGLCYGATDVRSNESLTDKAANELAALVPQGASLWVSALVRAQQLADAALQRRPDLAFAGADARINEMDFGIWEMQRWEDVPRPAFDRWMADFGHHRFGGKESTGDVLIRVASLLQDVRNTGVAHAVWVTHAGVIRAVQYIVSKGATDISDVSHWPELAPSPGGYLCIDV
ncbi:hypothetical protein NBRC116584_10960 [Hydrogenophaga sp. 5NK40-0174]